MENSRLVKYLKALDEAELSLFMRYLSSPFFLYRDTLRLLFEWLRAFAPDYQISAEAEGEFINTLFQGKARPRQRWNRLLSDATRELEKMMAVQAFLNDERALRLYASRAFSHRSSLYPFRASLAKFRKEIENAPWDHAAYDYRWQLEELAYSDSELDEHQPDKEVAEIHENLLETATAGFVFRYLKLKMSAISGRRVVQIAFLENDEAFYTMAIEPLARELAAGHPLVNAYFLLLQAYLHFNDRSHFEAFLDFALSPGAHIHSAEQLDLARLGINYCIQQQANSARVFFNLYDKLAAFVLRALEAANQRGISDRLFLNLALLLLAKGEWETYHRLLRGYRGLLPGEWQSDAIKLTEAYGLFFKGDFQPSADILETIGSRPLRYALRVQSLRVRVAYELSRQTPENVKLADQVEGRISAFRAFLRNRSRQQLAPVKRMQYLNFVEVLERMHWLAQHGQASKEQVGGLLELLKTSRPPFAEWLFIKITALGAAAE